MFFILYSEINAESIGANLGMPEYSYYFVLKGFQAALRTIGDVVIVQNPAVEVDPIFQEKQSQGVPCVFLSFSPPNKTVTTLTCPTISVFAWEFSNLPYEVWDDEPRNDWCSSLAQIAGAITLSTHTALVVKESMGEEYRVCAIPVPVFDESSSAVRCLPSLLSRQLLVSCTVISSRFYHMEGDKFYADIPTVCLRASEWKDGRIELTFKLGDEGSALMGGFYEPEPWGGAWSKTTDPWVLLPLSLAGKNRIGFELTAYGPNVGREISFTVGDRRLSLILTDDFVVHEFVIDSEQAVNLIQFNGLDTTVDPYARDPRSMGIGLRKLWVEQVQEGELPSVPSFPQEVPIDLEGVVYVSVLNPGDGRKNWIEMLTAFCYAFRFETRATLILKMTNRSIGAFLERFHYTLQRVGPIQCQVILLQGYLEDHTYKKLIDISTFYVNTSQCEGLCLPLMEFMSCGVPAIAPDHTSMNDYINSENAFVIEGTPEAAVWPHDTRNIFRTLCYRLNWRSLVDAFSESFSVAIENPQKYQQMSHAATNTQRGFSSLSVVETKLLEFLRGGIASRTEKSNFSIQKRGG